MKTNDVNITTVREAFDYLNSLDPLTRLTLPQPGERNPAGDAVECVTGEPVSAWIERWDGKSDWSVELLGLALRSHLLRRLSQRLASREWPVRLLINGEPVGRGLPVAHNVVIHDPTEGGGLERFMSGVAVACVSSRQYPTKLLIYHAENCPADVAEYLAALLRTGFGTTWPNGMRVEFDEQNFAIDLRLDITRPGTWDLIDRITRPLQANT